MIYVYFEYDIYQIRFFITILCIPLYNIALKKKGGGGGGAC